MWVAGLASVVGIGAGTIALFGHGVSNQLIDQLLSFFVAQTRN